MKYHDFMYENLDPRCQYPSTSRWDYCWAYAHHVDGTPGYEDLEAICRKCEHWKPERNPAKQGG